MRQDVVTSYRQGARSGLIETNPRRAGREVGSRYFATGGDSGEPMVYEWDSGVARPLPLPPAPNRPAAPYYSMDWSGDRFLAVGGGDPGGGGGLAIYDLISGVPVLGKFDRASEGYGIVCVKWSPNGKFLITTPVNASYGTAASVFTWIGDTLKRVGSLVGSSSGTPQAVAWSPDSRYVAIAWSSYDTFYLYDMGSGQTSPSPISATQIASNWTIRFLKFSPDGRKLVAGGAPSGNPIKIVLYDFNNGLLSGPTSPTTINNPPAAPSSYGSGGTAWSSDGRFLVFGLNADPWLWILDFSFGLPERRANPPGLDGIVYEASFSADDEYLMVSTGGASRIRMYEWRDGNPIEIKAPALSGIGYCGSFSRPIAD